MIRLENFLEYNRKTENIKQELLSEYSINKTNKDFFIRDLSERPWYYYKGMINIILEDDTIFSTKINYIYSNINNNLDFNKGEKIAILDSNKTTLGFVSNYSKNENDGDLIIVSVSQYHKSLDLIKNIISEYNEYVDDRLDYLGEYMVETGDFSMNSFSNHYLNSTNIKNHKEIDFEDLIREDGFILKDTDFKTLIFEPKIFSSEGEYNFQKAKFEKEDLLTQRKEIDRRIVILDAEINAHSNSLSRTPIEEAKTIEFALPDLNLDDDDFRDDMPF